MKITVDLHSHSGYAGGVGQIELQQVSASMKLKGIDVFGTGDCLFPPRLQELKLELQETEEGLFALPHDSSRFLLQTEVIFSTRLAGYRNKIKAHHLILFPNFSAVEKLQMLLQKWETKNTIGRPFLVTKSQKELEDKLFQMREIHPLIEIIPAHVMTPEGILGSKNNLSSMQEFYGNFLPEIHCIETGLSADPDMLNQIPELLDLTFISNSDCHSAALNRIGREFTMLRVNDKSYSAIVHSLRNNEVEFTAEFHPAEGRYFLTGHRADRSGHESEIIFNDNLPANLICPICGKKMNLGVLQRCHQLRDKKIIPRKRNYKHLIPLVEVIAESLNIKTVNSSRVQSCYQEIMKLFPSEIALWQAENVEVVLDKRVAQKTINRILSVQRGEFRFDPAGYDGVYGSLKIDANR
jgi:uncharacterized protein (TIGR00375 family)